MKHIPTLFVRNYDNAGRAFTPISKEVNPDCKWAFDGIGSATRQYDGTCCLIQDGKIYARYNLKPGRTLPQGAIPCQKEPNHETGYHPHWVLVEDQPQYKYHKQAFLRQLEELEDGTYELCGPNIQGNPECFSQREDILIPHKRQPILQVSRTYEGLRKYLTTHYIKGILFTHPDGRMCKISREDFGFPSLALEK